MNISIQLLDPHRSPLAMQSLSIWANPHWMSGLATVHNCVAYHLICTQNDHIVAYMPIYEKKQFGFHKAYSPVLGYYQPLEFLMTPHKSPNRNLLNQLEISSEIALFLKQRYLRLSINLHFQNYDVRGFTWNGISAKPLYTFQQSLANAFDIFSEQKKHLRRAQLCDYTSGYEFDPDRFIELTENLFKRKQHTFGISSEAFKKFLICQAECGNLRQFNLYQNDRIVSTNLLLCDATDTVYSVMRATDADCLKSGVSVLHSHLLVEQLQGQYKLVDWCGANTPGPARFKAAMGFELKVFFQLHK